MGAPPAYIFVVRHGNRLDAADKKWHLTSPTPYDPPLTYGGFNQSRQVGNQIAAILEQAKLEQEASNARAHPTKKRRRFKVIIHSSPFLRCVQTSIGISSGLAQTSSESLHDPHDVFISANDKRTQEGDFRSAILRLDTFLGEWMCPEYFEMITPPPGAALMIGSAKADLLRREDYSSLSTGPIPPQQTQRTPSGSLWSGSPVIAPASSSRSQSVASERDSSAPMTAMAAALNGQLAGRSTDQKKGYIVPRPNYASSGSGKIPDGLVAHARDECLVVDYQWDSMRPPLDFGDGGKLGEEWTSMHKRFRKGLKKMVHWYSTAEHPDEMVTKAIHAQQNGDVNHHEADEDEEVESVVILVSHGAGCNALIGAITHQPVLMDVGIASITMAIRKHNVNYTELLAAVRAEDSSQEAAVAVDQLYDIRMSASTEHLRSTNSTPVSARSSSTGNAWNSGPGSRGRAPSLGTHTGPVIGSFTYTNPFATTGSRSTSASAAIGLPARGESMTSRLPSTLSGGSPSLSPASTNGTGPRRTSVTKGSPGFGLWSPAPPSSLRLMDDGSTNGDNDKEDFDNMMPNFHENRFEMANGKQESTTKPSSGSLRLIKTLSKSRSISPLPVHEPIPEAPEPSPFSLGPPMQQPERRGPVLAAPIRINTNVETGEPAEEITIAQLGDGLGGLWGLPRPPGEAERIRDLSHAKRRWTVTERTPV